MPTAILNIKENTQTLYFTGVFYPSAKKNLIPTIDTSSYFFNTASIGFEPNIHSHLNYYSTNKLLTLIDNNFISISYKKYPVNYRIFLSNGTFFKKESFETIINLNTLNEIDSENNDSILTVSLTNIEKLGAIHSFLVQLKTKDNVENEIMGMKEIYLKVDELIDKKDYHSIDELIKFFINLDFSFQFHISLLASTLKIKQILSNRFTLVENALKEGEKVLTKAELNSTLKGLR